MARYWLVPETFGLDVTASRTKCHPNSTNLGNFGWYGLHFLNRRWRVKSSSRIHFAFSFLPRPIVNGKSNTVCARSAHDDMIEDEHGSPKRSPR